MFYKLAAAVHLHGYACDDGRLEIEVEFGEGDALIHKQLGWEAVHNRGGQRGELRQVEGGEGGQVVGREGG